jgi:hypothetical protein
MHLELEMEERNLKEILEVEHMTKIIIKKS